MQDRLPCSNKAGDESDLANSFIVARLQSYIGGEEELIGLIELNEKLESNITP